MTVGGVRLGDGPAQLLESRIIEKSTGNPDFSHLAKMRYKRAYFRANQYGVSE
jgi:hypothetical protein